MPNLIEQSGGGPQKQPKYVPIFIDRSFTGLFTQRSVLHDPADVVTSKFYGGRPDALWMGKNIELTDLLEPSLFETHKQIVNALFEVYYDLGTEYCQKQYFKKNVI